MKIPAGNALFRRIQHARGVLLTMGKLLVLVGLFVAAIGLLVMLGVPLGRLPGDIVIRRPGFTLYVPVTTCILISVLLTLVLLVARR